MKEIERIGLLKMDFLGSQHADAAERCRRGDSRDDRRVARPGYDSARRSEDVSDLRRRRDLRHLPVRELGHARHSPQGEAAAARRPDRVERALSARPAAQRHGRRLHRAQARQGEGHLRGEGARADPCRHLRRHRLPGTGDARRERARRIHARRSRPAAQGDGQEEGRRHAGAARRSSSTAPSAAASTRRRRPRSST